jgi:hypothetical protein
MDKIASTIGEIASTAVEEAARGLCLGDLPQSLVRH